MGPKLSHNKANQVNEKIDRFAEKYKLWLVIPLVICALLAIKNLHAGIGLLLFFVAIWLYTLSIGIILSACGVLLPNQISHDQRKALQEAGGATLFLGGLAIIGIILRGDNFVSNLVVEKMPGGMSLGFIDPIFAAIIIICFWVYTAFRIKG
jgi:hypothetical protein